MSSPKTALPDAARSEPVGRELWWLCGILMVGAFAVLLDGSIVNVAIDTLTNEFGRSLATVQWVITAYLLALCVTIPVSGWAMERFGAKRVWIAAQAIFLLGSVLCGIAWSAPALIAFRVLQGLGGGLIMPVGQALLAQSAPRSQLTRLMGLVSIPVMVAPVVGPAIGGLIIDGMGWRWIFYLNVPLCLAVIGLSFARIKDPGILSPRRLDTLGLFLLTPGLVAMLYGLSQAGTAAGFGSARSLGGIVIGAALLIGFGLHAMRAGSTALLDLRLFGNRGFAAGTYASFLLSAAMYGALILMPLYFQTVRGASATQAGLLLIPQGVGYVLAVGMIGGLAQRFGARQATLVGVVLAVAGTVVFALADADTSQLLLGVAMFVRGIGFGASMLPSTTIPLRSVAPAAVPTATSLFNILQRIGASLGTAVLAVILQHQIAGELSNGAGRIDALVHGYDLTFWAIVGITVVAVVPCWFLPGRTMPEPAPETVPVQPREAAP